MVKYLISLPLLSKYFKGGYANAKDVFSLLLNKPRLFTSLDSLLDTENQWKTESVQPLFKADQSNVENSGYSNSLYSFFVRSEAKQCLLCGAQRPCCLWSDCGKGITKRVHDLAHLTNHNDSPSETTPRNELICPICRKEFRRRSRVDACTNRHLGKRPFVCGGECGLDKW